ncbi:alpha-1 2-mannosidase [Sphingobacterium mizutaii NBRC 14946 = DSM 11724]|uniref:Alpha-1,2-mannosidase n=2 Tax=Sphingobacterium mizutaii TaxID=1010 RepID=A0AAJ5C273_9SPHI|nr:GH92 family glycosyl hydrolase [Sphingobacterium mizutaii]GEM66777.1 alpha-1 2-mannosidase [Sphingobacterium mizutaii NBRC 14946 = DSM 11724]SDL58310.1 alpha-1,2-mannosidase, putative [Sphingobacterium mizutaii]SNV64507.1 Putative alpha-1,2-mannosidase [Sphingobacterium mizutaii]
MQLKSLISLFILLVQGASLLAQKPDLVKYVNTLQGTHSEYALSYGNTYPTIGLPFAVHFFSAQTGKNGDGWKYQYQADKIRGFQQVHQCSPWMNDYAVFSLMPGIGELTVNEDQRALKFSHANEIAKPHYYSVKFDNGIRTEISPVERGAHMRFSFPKNGKANLVFDGYTKDCEIKIIPEERKIIGYVNNGRIVPENFKSYFVLEFNQDFKSYGTWENEKGSIKANNKEDLGKGVGAYLEFKPGSKVEVKMASSYISPEQAELNFKQELADHKNLEVTKKKGFEIWNELLNRVLVEGGTEEDRATFYSCLFRANLFSRKFYEIDAKGNPYYYSPYDGKIHSGYMYTDNGFWDTFRAQFPLSNILHQQMQGRYMQSLLDAQQQAGFYPTWSNPGMSGVMIGNHAISLLTDAWVKGVRTFDPDSALSAYYHETTNKGFYGGSNGREGWKEYYTLGYIPYGDIHESTAKTLEYAYDDFCAYQLAKLTGNTFYENVFGRQMYNYRNVFDPKVNFVRGRLANGEWRPDFDPVEWGGPFTEANAWQYTWSVLHNIEDLIGMIGGQERFNAKLDSFFTMDQSIKYGSYKQEIHEMREMLLAKMGQYAHGNQPTQHVPYLYNFSGEPWKAQKQVRMVCKQLYNATEKGYPGDEDQGQMSSWYVLSALGIYSVCPGTDQYVIGSPVFEKATISLENGKTFVIQAKNNNAENVYIQSAELNGKGLDKNYISFDDINKGGEIVFQMSGTPNKSRGTSKEARPFSLMQEQ